MTRTVEFLDAVKSRHHVGSDYALRTLLQVSKQTISRYRNGEDYLGDIPAARVAELLEIDPGYVVACAHAERAKKPEEKAIWQHIMQKLGGAAALVLIGLGGLSAPSPAQASPASASEPISIMSNRRNGRGRHKSSTFGAVFGALLPIRTIQHI
jgi:hypothetical protein